MTDEITEWEAEVARIKDVPVTTLEIGLPQDVKDAAEQLIKEEAWGEDGYLRIFATGLEFLRGERRLSHLSGDALDAATKEDTERAVKQLMEESSRFAVLRFKAYRMAEDNQTLAMRETAWRTDAEMLQERVRRFREDEQLLRARIRELEMENADLRGRVVADESGTEAPPARHARRGPLAIFRRRRSSRS